MKLVKSMIGVSLLSLLGSLVSFVNQIIIANFFGAGKALDVYLLASSVPFMISGLITSGLSFSLIPQLIKMQVNLELAYSDYLGQLLRKGFLYSFILAIIGSVIFFLVIPVIYTSLNSEEIQLARSISVLSWVSIIPSIILSIINCSLNARKSFYFPLLLTLAPYILTIILTFLFYKSLGTNTIALGVLAGSFVGMFAGYQKMKSEIRLFTNDKQFYKEIDKFFYYLRYAIIAMLTFSIFQSIDSFWATKLGESNLSYLSYSQRILIALGALVIAGPSTVLIPRLTSAIQENRNDDFLNDTVYILKILITLSGVIGVLASVMSKPLIRIMFQRGAFLPDDTIRMSMVFPYLLIGMIFMLCVVILFRILFVKDSGKRVANIGIICLLTYFILSGVLSKYIGIRGIAISYLMTWIIIFGITIETIFSKSRNFFYNLDTLLFIVKLFLSMLIMFWISVETYSLLKVDIEIDSFLELILKCIGITFGSVSVFLILVLYVFRVKEIKGFLNMAVRTFINK